MSCCCNSKFEYSDGEVEDDDAEHLSYVGDAAYQILRTRHDRQHHKLWNVTSGAVVDRLQQTPIDSWQQTRDPDAGHDDWFPDKMAEIMARTERWCDGHESRASRRTLHDQISGRIGNHL